MVLPKKRSDPSDPRHLNPRPFPLRLPKRVLPSSLRRSAFSCLFAPLAGILLGLGFTACGKRETAVERGNREQILHRGVGPEIGELDPHLASGLTEYNILIALLEGLVSEDPINLKPVPGVAQTWDISADNLTYTFHLRANARWSSGDAVTAHDFVASYRRVLTPSLAAQGAAFFYIIQNAEPFHKGALTDFSKVGIVAADPHTLRITLEHPVAHFLSMLNHTAFLPVHVASIEKTGSSTQRGNPWARPGTFIGNGPFVLADWKAGQRIVVQKSTAYWDSANVRLNGVHFHAIESRDAEERAFRAGQLHLTEALAPSKIDAYRRDNPTALRLDSYLGTEFYRLNVTRPFLNDRRVRRALALAVDRSAIVEKILRGGQAPAHAFTHPGIAHYVSSASIPTDPAAARALLAEAGYPGGKGAPTIELLYNTSESHRAVAETVQEFWRRALGLEIRLVNQEWKTLQSTRRTGDFQVLRSVWNPDYLDPLSFLNVWTSSSADNYTGWSSPDYDQLLFRAARTADAEARNKLLQQAEALLLDDAPLIPLYHYTHVFLIQPSVKGWHPTPLDHHPYKHVYLEN
jgi:oligopeptide transport system substrate-binding protein